jgi:lysozyme
MDINAAGLKLIKDFEGCKLMAYKDIVGVLTIGYGSTGAHVTPGLKISQVEADALLIKDLRRFEDGVEKLVTCELTGNQFSALVCFSFNVGLGSLKSSTMLKLVNSGDFKGAAEQFLRWNKAQGKVIAGLTRRRTAERDLFLS